MQIYKLCSSCKKEKEISNFYNQKNHKHNVMSMCKSCFNEYSIRRWINRKIDVINYYGGKCLDCNLKLTDSHYSVFEFHHKEKLDKEFNWTKLRLKSIDKIHAELNKCDLLCANCHRIRHAIINENNKNNF